MCFFGKLIIFYFYYHALQFVAYKANIVMLYLEKYPKAAYWSEVESWRELPGDVIEFTMRRLPTAD